MSRGEDGKKGNIFRKRARAVILPGGGLICLTMVDNNDIFSKILIEFSSFKRKLNRPLNRSRETGKDHKMDQNHDAEMMKLAFPKEGGLFLMSA